jgi:hypothetical protein
VLFSSLLKLCTTWKWRAVHAVRLAATDRRKLQFIGKAAFWQGLFLLFLAFERFGTPFFRLCRSVSPFRGIS